MRNRCPTCQGTGKIRKWKWIRRTIKKCKDCNGTGYILPPVKPMPPPPPPDKKNFNRIEVKLCN